MQFRSGIAAVAILASFGCTHRQLTRSTVQTTGTVMDIHYRTVLTNLAMFSCNPEALPNHIRLKDGVVQINDEVGFGNSGGFTMLGGSDFGFERYGPSGSRQVTEQWGSDAVGDPIDLKTLQDLYRSALLLPPLPDPEAIAYIKRVQPSQAGDGGEDKSDSDDGSSDSPSTASRGCGSALSTGNGSSGGGDDSEVPIEVLLRDVPPPGWYHVGCKRDVPKDACHVGRYGELYCWVTPGGMPGLSRFTITILNVLKFKAGRESGSHGLAVTR